MIRPTIKSLLRSLNSSSPLEGLESRFSFSGNSSSLQPVWFSMVENHSQVISPGRSGTRWVANVMLETTNALVCHASPKTLSEVGYLFNHSLISQEEALGAYRFSRSDYLEYASLKQRPFVDLDCKNSPIAHVIAKAYPKCRFIVILRDPLSFIKSGIVRGYFLDKNSQAWGHLDPPPADFDSLPSQDEQIFRIAFFWRQVARLSQQMRDQYPSRVFIVNSSVMFGDPAVISSLLDRLTIDHGDVSEAKAWPIVSNSNKKRVVLGSDQKQLMASDFLYDFCVDGLDGEFIAAAGTARLA